MNLKLMKIVVLLAIVFCVVNGIFADDWEATIYDNERLEKANDTVKGFIEKKMACTFPGQMIFPCVL